MIYFAQLPTGAIKIGCTTNLHERIKHLRHLFGRRLIILGVMAGGFDQEREMHERFDSLKLDSVESKELFSPGSELLAFIQSLTTYIAPGKPAGPGRPVRVADDVVSMARRISDFRGVMLSDYLSEVLRPAVQRDYQLMLRKLGEAK